jgi:cell division protein ZapA (FtsZ GTPase activity inhibitor)
MGNDSQSNHIIQVTVLIAGRPYLLRVNASDEVIIHRLVQEINDKIAGFKASQPSKDVQDCMAMALLTYAIEQQRKTAG